MTARKAAHNPKNLWLTSILVHKKLNPEWNETYKCVLEKFSHVMPKYTKLEAKQKFV